MSKEPNIYNQMKDKFLRIFHQELLPILTTIEKEREKAYNKALLMPFIYFFISMFFFYLVTKTETLRFLYILLGCIFFKAMLSVYRDMEKDFENNIKNKVMPKLLSCFSNLKRKNLKHIERELFSNSKIIPTFYSIEFDDIFTGEHKNVNFDIIESKFMNKDEATVFKGVIIKYEINKKFSSHTLIFPNSILHKNIVELKGLHHITLEDTKFEKTFDVYTNDDVEARYLITTSFIERLNNIKTAFSVNSIRCAFYDNFLLIALENERDLFSLFTFPEPVTDEKRYFQMYKEIESIIKLIDHFKLDKKIGL